MAFFLLIRLPEPRAPSSQHTSSRNRLLEPPAVTFPPPFLVIYSGTFAVFWSQILISLFPLAASFPGACVITRPPFGTLVVAPHFLAPRQLPI